MPWGPWWWFLALRKLLVLGTPACRNNRFNTALGEVSRLPQLHLASGPEVLGPAISQRPAGRVGGWREPGSGTSLPLASCFQYICFLIPEMRVPPLPQCAGMEGDTSHRLPPPATGTCRWPHPSPTAVTTVTLWGAGCSPQHPPPILQREKPT